MLCQFLEINSGSRKNGIRMKISIWKIWSRNHKPRAATWKCPKSKVKVSITINKKVGKSNFTLPALLLFLLWERIPVHTCNTCDSRFAKKSILSKNLVDWRVRSEVVQFIVQFIFGLLLYSIYCQGTGYYVEEWIGFPAVRFPGNPWKEAAPIWQLLWLHLWCDDVAI